ncbi:MAG: hypothetical protein HON53_07640 [Planctomycetaceae bacterium]|jgi:hypothetical protein|nr:hypothetical protein [Planctomycetaceae bacterium]MBT6158065.1 hypothetical protein [Planctomycetaceae bacterium]MBT6486495.1 hypothetical protein [Planctomycetaceae bacterium]MBT6495818.1 hypothetical protein [Planctomycetaceae bacterium]
MRSTLPMTLLLVTVTAFVGGCGESDPPTDAGTGDQTAVEQPAAGHPHSHEGGDALVWVEEDVEHEGFVLALGHHGKHLHAAEFVEPAVSITRDGAAVADAKVFNSLVSADGEEVIREEVPTIYEPETEDEPAHYAQGKLHLPKGSAQFIIRFRIELPGVKEELTRDITIDVEDE